MYFENVDIVDSHGFINILEENWDNLLLERSPKKPVVILGATLNCLLRGLFLIQNASTDEDIQVSGGILCWSAIEENVLVTLVSVATIDEVISRIVFVLQSYLETGEFFNIALGSLKFLLKWMEGYHCFLSDPQLVDLRVGVNRICQTGICNSPCACGPLSTSLKQLGSILSASRSCQTTSSPVSYTTSITPQWSSKCHSLHEDITNTVRPGPVAPGLHHMVGTWDAPKVVEAAPKPSDMPKPADTGVKLEIFGGDAMYNSLFDDETSEDDEPEPSDSDVSVVIPIGPPLPPTPRIPTGFSLLQDPRELSIWTFDGLEIARQWTLIDHALFKSISLSSMMVPTWSEPRHFPTSASSVRKFIDRFNTESLWATATVLDDHSPEGRAERYTQLVHLASHLDHLHNFNGMMAVISALQQPCIKQLSSVLALVHPTDKTRLEDMQNLMSGNKNYRNYREEISLRRPNIDYTRLADPVLNCGIVPHLGAHLAEIVTISEGNTEYIPDTPHMINVPKKVMLSRCLITINAMQQSTYDLYPIRLVATVINRTMQQYMNFTTADASAAAKEMFKLAHNS